MSGAKENITKIEAVNQLKVAIVTDGEWAGISARLDDAYIMWEVIVAQEYRGLIEVGDTVLDLGGHVGIFGAWAFMNGANRIISVEPQPESYRVLVTNAGRINAANNRVVWTTMPAAAVGRARSTKIYGHGMSASTEPKATQISVDVPGLATKDLIRATNPNVLKMDIEGAEYDCLKHTPNKDFKEIERMAVEWHFHTWESLPAAYKQDQRLLSLGFKTARDLTIPVKPTKWGRHVVYAK